MPSRVDGGAKGDNREDKGEGYRDFDHGPNPSWVITWIMLEDKHEISVGEI